LVFVISSHFDGNSLVSLEQSTSLQPQNFVAQQQVVASQMAESASSGGRPDGSAAIGSKSSGFISKIFGKPRDSQEEMQCKLF
jgi:hypothetical protein